MRICWSLVRPDASEALQGSTYLKARLIHIQAFVPKRRNH